MASERPICECGHDCRCEKCEGFGGLFYTNCDRCSGTGTMKLTGFISYSNGRHEAAHEKPMKCTECYGRGSVSGWTRKMRRIAEHIRRGRIELDVTQGEQAKIVGMSFSDWNAILRGRMENSND
jgi:RecJ-like exonuclease